MATKDINLLILILKQNISIQDFIDKFEQLQENESILARKCTKCFPRLILFQTDCTRIARYAVVFILVEQEAIKVMHHLGRVRGMKIL